jgi:hypothetical protein
MSKQLPRYGEDRIVTLILTNPEDLKHRRQAA